MKRSGPTIVYWWDVHQLLEVGGTCSTYIAKKKKLKMGDKLSMYTAKKIIENWRVRCQQFYVDEKCINNWMSERSVLLSCLNSPNFKGSVLDSKHLRKINNHVNNTK